MGKNQTAILKQKSDLLRTNAEERTRRKKGFVINKVYLELSLRITHIFFCQGGGGGEVVFFVHLI